MGNERSYPGGITLIWTVGDRDGQFNSPPEQNPLLEEEARLEKWYHRLSQLKTLQYGVGWSAVLAAGMDGSYAYYHRFISNAHQLAWPIGRHISDVVSHFAPSVEIADNLPALGLMGIGALAYVGIKLTGRMRDRLTDRLIDIGEQIDMTAVDFGE